MIVSSDIIGYADIHYGEYSFSGSDPETGLNRRLLEIAEADRLITDYAIKNKIALIIFAGDRFRLRNPQGYIRDMADEEMKRRSKLGITSMMLVGNHDQYEKSRVKGDSYGAARIFKDDLPNVVIMSEPITYEYKNQSILVHALPAGYSMEDAKFSIDKECMNILVIHDLLDGSIMDERSGLKFHTNMFMSSIDSSDFDLVIAGDNHIPQQLPLKNTQGLYMGSTVQVDRGDIGERGFWHFCCHEKGIDSEMVKTSAPELVSVRCEYDEIRQKGINCNKKDYKWFTLLGTFTEKEKKEIKEELGKEYGKDRLQVTFEPKIETVISDQDFKSAKTPNENWCMMVDQSQKEGLDAKELKSIGEEILVGVSN